MNVLDSFRLDGQAAIVTGASKGLGHAMATALAQAGADVLITSRNQEEVEEAATEIAAETGKNIVPLVSDVGNQDDVRAMVDTDLAMGFLPDASVCGDLDGAT